MTGERLEQTRRCPNCGWEKGLGYCPVCHGVQRSEDPHRIVGRCAECDTAVTRLPDDETMASCVCGKTRIPMKFMAAARKAGESP